MQPREDVSDLIHDMHRKEAEASIKKTLLSIDYYLKPHGPYGVIELTGITLMEWQNQLREVRRLIKRL